MKTVEFDYELPPELIAAYPTAERSSSRMMVVDCQSGSISHHRFEDFEALRDPEHLVVLNDTKVVPARFFSDDGQIEFLRTGVMGEGLWTCLVKPGKRAKVGREVRVEGKKGVVEAITEEGERVIRWEGVPDLSRVGELPLPGYMDRKAEKSDEERYQTVYAKNDGAIAAPTAGLHFTKEILKRVDHEFLTLHVGVGTFRPVKVEEVEDHVMHREWFQVDDRVAKRVNSASGILAVGTTVTRVLEHLGRKGGAVRSGSGETGIFIKPPYEFQVVKSLLTNFHLPQSTLLMLVCALAGKELMLEAYAKAVEEKYRFYSYGDCMLIK